MIIENDQTGAHTPKAIICGMLIQDEKILFLVKKENGKEKIEMPCIMGSLGADPIGQLVEAFAKQTGIKAFPKRVAMEGKHNVGTETEPAWVPVVVYEMLSTESEITPDPFTGIERCEWLTLMAAKKKPLTANGKWINEDIELIEGQGMTSE